MTTRLLDSEKYMAQRESLDHPDVGTVRNAFARLPKRGYIEVRCRWDRRLEFQQILTDTGAFAIHILPLAAFQEVQVTALKGKVGACFETGRSATYVGAALAVMDDDHHLIVGTIRVCEKTGGLYTLPPYRRFLTVTEGNVGLLERLETDPIPFDCNTFEPDAERLASMAFNPETTGDLTTPVFYSGPFSLLVLRDGTILRRGHCTQVTTSLVKDLQVRDGLLIVPPHLTSEADPPINFPVAFKCLGAGCLLSAAVTSSSRPVAVQDKPSGVPLSKQALDALRQTSDALRQRLLRLIEGREPYFILTGSDPKDPLGCCPNIQVGEANRLVDVGLLSSFQENAAADSCTTTFFAFEGEITVHDNHPFDAARGGPAFIVNEEKRREVGAVLSRINGRLRILRTTVQGLLLLLVAASLVVAGWRAWTPFRATPDGYETAMAKALDLTTNDHRLFVCLFRNSETCATCRTLDGLCLKTIEAGFSPQATSGNLAFRKITYDAQENRAIMDRLGIYSTTIGLVRYEHGKPKVIRMLTSEVWGLWPDEEALARMLKERIQGLLPENW